MLCFSENEPPDWGPRRVTQDEIRDVFADGWRVEAIEPADIKVTLRAERVLCGSLPSLAPDSRRRAQNCRSALDRSAPERAICAPVAVGNPEGPLHRKGSSEHCSRRGIGSMSMKS